MTGWRVGYTGSSREIAKLMGSIQSHATSNPNSIAQKAAVEALDGPQETVDIMRDEFDKKILHSVQTFFYLFHADCIRKTNMFRKSIDFYKDTVQVPNGNVVEWDFIGHKGAAAVVPVMEDGKILMVNRSAT